MSTAAAGRRKKRGTPSASDAAAAAPARTLGRSVGSAATDLPFGRVGGLHRSLGHGVGLAPLPRSLGRGGGPAAAATPPATIAGSCGGGFPSSSAAMGGFPFPPPFDGFPSSSSLLDVAGGDASSPGSWDNNLHPSGGFMSYFSNHRGVRQIEFPGYTKHAEGCTDSFFLQLAYRQLTACTV